MICISCNYEHSEKFCPNCGEKTGTPKITFSSTVETTFATITNMDKGFLYNLKNLTLKPKATIEKYLRGKRKGIFNPISFLVISISVYLVVESLLKANNIVSEEQVNMIKDQTSYKIGSSAGRFIKDYLKFFWIFSVVPLSILTKLFFKQHNFAEHITINSFVLGHVTLIIGLLSFLIFRFSILFNPFIYLGLLWYIHRVFYDAKNKWDSLLKSLTIIFLFLIMLLLIITIIGLLKLN
ncbi:uncharacterized protein DUF3667 [Tenacibaculum skagerrakense]|uniref:Uncharacterized protein DUF3667 n=1 Tax=Tenacibaculum skagerrakense TaxID=186571 RepID=A0A4R2NXE3_9FLAO|nr:DUF3667 domain-containing protein [Tenacibaculum skagerrakense]TCP26810.1 uncharacterized protein DUF3667 [Tenacibaculum skagerrakense]